MYTSSLPVHTHLHYLYIHYDGDYYGELARISQSEAQAKRDENRCVVTEVGVTEAVQRGVVLGVCPHTTTERRIYAVKIARLRRLVTRPEYHRQLSLCTPQM